MPCDVSIGCLDTFCDAGCQLLHRPRFVEVRAFAGMLCGGLARHNVARAAPSSLTTHCNCNVHLFSKHRAALAGHFQMVRNVLTSTYAAGSACCCPFTREGCQTVHRVRSLAAHWLKTWQADGTELHASSSRVCNSLIWCACTAGEQIAR